MCDNKLPTVSDKIKRINEIVAGMDDGIEFFSTTHHKFEGDVEKELAFENNINFFYGLFFERCDIYKNFILQKIQLYKLNYKEVSFSINLIHDIRTYKNHGLDKNKSHDNKIIMSVEKWHYNLTGSKQIDDSKYRIERTKDLTSRADKILNSILRCVEKIDGDGERRKDMIDEMLMLKCQYFPEHKIEDCFKKALNKFGIKVDAKKLTKKYGCKIRDKIKLNSDDDKTKNIDLWIEDMLFSEKIVCCPLGADRIMSEFGLKPGKELGKLKKRAVDLFNENKFLSEEKLLDKLKEFRNETFQM